MEILQNHRILLIVIVGYTLLILFIGLRPFRFNMLNSVSWLNDKKGIKIGKAEPNENFTSKGIVYSKDKLMIKKKIRTWR